MSDSEQGLEQCVRGPLALISTASRKMPNDIAMSPS